MPSSFLGTPQNARILGLDSHDLAANVSPDLHRYALAAILANRIRNRARAPAPPELSDSHHPDEQHRTKAEQQVP
jgi:hypothetical protein